MRSTSAVAISIQAVSPPLSVGGGAAAGACAKAPTGKRRLSAPTATPAHIRVTFRTSL
jgi:hypothetical protein